MRLVSKQHESSSTMGGSISQTGGSQSESIAPALSSLSEGDRLKLLIQGVTDCAICMLDGEGRFASWNAGAEKIMGYRSAEILGQPFSRFFTERDRAANLPAQLLEEAMLNGRSESEGWQVRKDGSQFLAGMSAYPLRDASGLPAGFAVVVRDVTVPAARQEALLESERQFRLLVEGVTDYALYMLDPNGNVTSWNTGAQRIKGYEADEILGQHFSRFYIERDRAAGVPARTLQVAAAEGRFEAEGWRVGKNGQPFWAHVIIDSIRDNSGNLTGFAKITRDITEKHYSGIALQKVQDQKGRAQRMEALGHLTGGVAHDFNNVLMVIGGFAQTLKKIAGGDPKGARAIEAIEISVQRGQSLTRQLLTFSRRQTLNPVVTGVAERIESFSKMLGSSNADPVKLIVDVAPDTWPVMADTGELELALLNVTLNARDAMPNGGVLTITAENVQLQREATPAEVEGEFVAITIADTGTGIPEEILSNVFDPFFTTKSRSKGSGLGLSQVYGFAHQSGGAVTIESKVGHGTQVILYLPRTKTPPEKKAGAAVPHVAGGGKALLVDDNRDVLEVSALYLQELGYQVDTMDSAQPALEAFGREKYALVVSDIVMAGMDGIDLAEAIRLRQPDMPIVLMTGYSRIPASVGEQFVLVRKPYNLADLSCAVSTAIAAAARPQSSNLVHLGDRRPPRGADPA
ncbi:MAG: PAS domain S-box protein [Rhodomicrobium sp.]